MEFTDKIHLEITPLTKTEQDQLTGGFVSSQIKSEAEGVRNGNCSDASSWFNGNCGCNACQPAQKVE